MKRIAIYPGSFNPFHQGHEDIVVKALQVFDKVIIARGIDPKKQKPDNDFGWGTVKITHPELAREFEVENPRIDFCFFITKLVDFVKTVEEANAVIRGLRSGYDLEHEMKLQYWNEDLGLKIPTILFICDRKLTHISSSAIRDLKKFDER